MVSRSPSAAKVDPMKVAETAMTANVVSANGSYPPARAKSGIRDSPIQGLHLRTFEVGVMDGSGEIVGLETMTAIVNFATDATVTFFLGVTLDDAGNVRATRLWGHPPGMQREL
jgi:hypothetical protein